jgi:hypothetical protein
MANPSGSAASFRMAIGRKASEFWNRGVVAGWEHVGQRLQ